MAEVAWSADGSAWYAVEATGALLRVDRESGEATVLPSERLAFPLLPAAEPDVAGFSLSCSPDGQWLAVVSISTDGSPLDGAQLCHLPTGDWWAVRTGAWCVLAFAPDERTLAASEGGGVRLWDLPSRTNLGLFHASIFYQNMTFSPEGDVLAVATTAGDVRLLPWQRFVEAT
jgi:WD40 repeat protein